MQESSRSHLVLFFNTFAFMVCFAAWMLNGVLVTFLIENQVFQWTPTEIGVLIGTPVLTGALMRLPLGMATDKYGGKPVFTLVLLAAAVPMFLLGHVDDFTGFFLCSLGFGLAGASFAVGIAFTSVWYSRERQGLALGIFGAGNAGAAITTLGAPSLLAWLTDHGASAEGWRTLPTIYGTALVVTAALFVVGTQNRRPEGAERKSIRRLLRPLAHVRVWRFGLYYFLVFGGFVALAQWLVPYYVNVYAMSIVTAGLMTSIFSFPSGVIRALGGWMSDKFGARRVLYGTLATIAVCCLLLFFPKMDIESPGKGVMATADGTVTSVTDTEIVIGEQEYALTPPPESIESLYTESETYLLPVIRSWQVPAVEIGDEVRKKELIGRGITHIYFQANMWVFTALVFLIGIAMGIGMAAVYRYIADYFPEDVGVVGGIVGVLGGLGGFVCPIVFGYLLEAVGLWTTTWMFLAALSVVCILWLSIVARRMSAQTAGQRSRTPAREPCDHAAATSA